MRKTKSDVDYALMLNCLHLSVCFLCYGLRKFGLFGYTVVQVSILIIDLLIWFFFGTACALAKNDHSSEGGLRFGFVSLSPVALLTFITFTSNLLIKRGPKWILFSTLGSSINFYFKPLMLIGSFLRGNVYLIYLINIMLMLIVLIFSYFYGARFNGLKGKKSQNVSRETF
jgi:hypothetical protein